MVGFIVFFVACWLGFIGGGAADDLPALSENTNNDDVSLKVQVAETDSRHTADSSSSGTLPSSPPTTAENLADLGDGNHCATLGCHGIGEPISNSCADMDLSIFTPGMVCGSPLSGPCFNHSRCLLPPDGPGPTIYVHDAECSLANSSDLPISEESIRGNHHVSPAWRLAAKEAGVLAETYESACVFIHVNTKTPWPCPSETPLWNNGVNHLMVDFGDISRAERPAVAGSLAMEAASNMHTCYYRAGYDMSVPLYPRSAFTDLAPVLPEDRQFFITVKGSVYLSGHGSEERLNLVPLHDADNGVIMSLHCFEIHQEHLLPENVEYCERLHERYDEVGYGDIMNTTFGLVPAGRSPGSYRLGEVMSSGAIPVFVGRDLVPPFREQFDWGSFSFMFSPDQVGPAMIQTLRNIPPEELKAMQQKSLDAYWKIFGGKVNTFEVIARNIVDLFIQRVAYYH